MSLSPVYQVEYPAFGNLWLEKFGQETADSSCDYLIESKRRETRNLERGEFGPIGSEHRSTWIFLRSHFPDPANGIP